MTTAYIRISSTKPDSLNRIANTASELLDDCTCARQLTPLSYELNYDKEPKEFAILKQLALSDHVIITYEWNVEKSYNKLIKV